VMGGDENQVTVITATGSETWPRAPKTKVAQQLAAHIAAHLSQSAVSRGQA